MKALQKINVPWLFFFVAFAVSLYASLNYPPIGADIQFHFEVTRVYLAGGNGMFAPNVMEINRIPYPPLFHMVLLPSVALGVGEGFVLALQALFYPVILLGTLLLMNRFGASKLALAVAGASMLGSMAYVDATFQVRPETLDMALWLIFSYALLAGKTKSGILSAVAGVYNHSFPMLMFMGGGLIWKRNWKQIAWIVGLSLPILVVTGIYLSSFAEKWFLVAGSSQAADFLANVGMFTFVYLGALLVGIPVVVISAWKWKTLTDLQKLSLATIVSSLAMVPFWYDRYYHYISIPLAILIGTSVAGTKTKLLKFYGVFFVLAFAVVTYWQLWQSNLFGLWDIH